MDTDPAPAHNPSADQCLESGAAAVNAAASGDHGSARAHLAPIAGDLWQSMPPWKRPPARARAEMIPTASPRRFTPALAAATYVRDRFQCRYCGQRLIPVCLMSVLSVLFPDELPYVSTYKQGMIHRAYWEIGAEADHILAGKRGGGWIDPDNHATACVLCNTRKSDWTLEELGWTLRSRPDPGWNGLIDLYRPLWRRAGEPAAGGQRAWMRAFEAATSRSTTEAPRPSRR